MPNNTGGITLVNPVSELFTFRFIDADGELTAFPLEIKAGATDQEVNDLLDAIGAASNASLYAMEITAYFGGVPLQSNAINAVHTSVQDQLVSLWKDLTLRKSQRVYVPAPIAANFVANTDTPDVSAQTIVDLQAAANAALAPTFAPVSIRFTQSRKINERIRF